MPWTTFDPAGDITTYEGFETALRTEDLTYAEGERWHVGDVATHMRTIKLTRKARQGISSRSY